MTSAVTRTALSWEEVPHVGSQSGPGSSVQAVLGTNCKAPVKVNYAKENLHVFDGSWFWEKLDCLHIRAERNSTACRYVVAQELYVADVENTLLQVDDQTKMLQPLKQDPQV